MNVSMCLRTYESIMSVRMYVRMHACVCMCVPVYACMARIHGLHVPEMSHIALYIDAATHAETSGVLFQWTPTALVGWAPSDVWVDVGHSQPRHADLITSLSCLHAWRGRAVGAADDGRILISGARLC